MISKLVGKHVDELFIFLGEPDLPYSTNTAEGEIKSYADLRRKTPCHRSPTSAEETLTSSPTQPPGRRPA